MKLAEKAQFRSFFVVFFFWFDKLASTHRFERVVKLTTLILAYSFIFTHIQLEIVVCLCRYSLHSHIHPLKTGSFRKFQV